MRGTIFDFWCKTQLHIVLRRGHAGTNFRNSVVAVVCGVQFVDRRSRLEVKTEELTAGYE